MRHALCMLNSIALYDNIPLNIIYSFIQLKLFNIIIILCQKLDWNLYCDGDIAGIITDVAIDAP